jgi:hypothetical protein
MKALVVVAKLLLRRGGGPSVQQILILVTKKRLHPCQHFAPLFPRLSIGLTPGKMRLWVARSKARN